MGLNKLVLVILLFWLVDDGTALVCNIQNGCFLGSTCTANDLAGITNMTRNDTVCYTAVSIISGQLQLYRNSWTGSCSDGAMCGASSSTANIFWMQCCSSGDKCNSITIPAGVTSLNSLEQCYLGLTGYECQNPSSVVQPGCTLIGTTKRPSTAATTTPTPAAYTTLQTQIVKVSQNNSQVNNMQMWQLQENDLTVLFNLIYGKLAPYWTSNVTALAMTVSASKALAVATNLMYAKEADIDIQNLYASLYNTTLQAETCCGWSYNTSYTPY